MANREIGRSIRLLRENAGFTQDSLARFMGIDQSTVSKIEKGERGLSTEMIDKLSALFAVDPEQITEGRAATPKLSLAFRGSELSTAEMEAVAAINRIALNSELVSTILEEGAR